MSDTKSPEMPTEDLILHLHGREREGLLAFCTLDACWLHPCHRPWLKTSCLRRASGFLGCALHFYDASALGATKRIAGAWDGKREFCSPRGGLCVHQDRENWLFNSNKKKIYGESLGVAPPEENKVEEPDLERTGQSQLVRMQRHWDTCALLVGMKNGADTTENLIYILNYINFSKN